MREMILNHASFVPAGWHEAVDSLRGVASGMAALVNGGAAQPILRMQDSTDRIRCADGRSLFEAFMELRGQGERDSYLFLVRLSQKVPLLNDLGPDITERFQMCDATTLPRHDGAPLVLCAITDAIAVAFLPSRSGTATDFRSISMNCCPTTPLRMLTKRSITLRGRRTPARFSIATATGSDASVWTRQTGGPGGNRCFRT